MRSPTLRTSLFVGTLGLGLGFGLLAAPPTTHAALTSKAVAVELPTLAPLVSHKVKTKAGTVVPVWLLPGSEWQGSPDWYPSGKASTQPATGEVVLIVCDSGDGATAEPLVRLLQAMGTTVVLFDDPHVDFDNPLAGGRKVEGDEGPLGVGSKDETPADVLHAMISWTTTHARADGRRTKIHLFGIGRGADLALEVGATRTADLRSILVDNPSTKILTAAGPKLAAKLGSDFAGAIVVHSTTKLGRPPAGVSLAPDSMTYEKGLNIADLSTVATFQRDIAILVAGEAMERCCSDDELEPKPEPKPQPQPQPQQ